MELTVVICVLASSFIVAVGTLPFLAEPGFEDVRAVLDGLENSICIVAGPVNWNPVGMVRAQNWVSIIDVVGSFQKVLL